MSSAPCFKSTSPLVSIGLPIYNEERFLSQTLDSLLAQDYENFEIIISDNASTDATNNICQDYCRESRKIKYLRFDKNMGQGANFPKVLIEAQGDYFMWACGHDKWSKNFISECLTCLETHPSAIVAVPASNWIDQNGQNLEKESGFSDTRGMDIIARYFTMFWGNMHPAFGLMRTNIIKTWVSRNIIGNDLLMMTFLALKGDFVHADKALWSRREFRYEKSYKERVERYKYGAQKVVTTKFDRFFPFIKLPYYLVITVVQGNIPVFAKILIVLLLIPSFVVRYFSGKYQYDNGLQTKHNSDM